MTFERWDVAVALFPLTDTSVQKPRPVVILSSAGFNAEHDHVIAAMITTGAGSRWSSDHPVGDLQAAGLRQPCVVRWKIFTLPAGVIARRVGQLSGEDQAALASRLAGILLA
jgi:mRNA interferase MazF